jgi:hypothetical protein
VNTDSLTPTPKHRRKFRRWLFGAATLALVVTMAFLIRPLRESPFLHDPRFIVTTRPTLASNTPFTFRVLMWWQSVHKPNPLASTFSAHGKNLCSIHGLLNQCMDVTGVRYVIAKEVAAGSFQFGHTNALNGSQWVAAVAHALQNDNPEWWDFQAKKFHRENLVFITNNSTTVLVVPKSRVQEFAK